MTAAAVPAGRTQGGGSRALPDWAQRGNWTPMPNAFFTHVMRACSQFEQAILSLILYRTAGDVQRGRPEWVRLSETQIARFLKGHPNGISRAIGNLEEMGAIESRRVGRAKEYRAVVEAWDQLTPREARKVEPKQTTKPTAEAHEEDAELSAPVPSAALRQAPLQNQVLVILPGQRKPLPLADACPGGSNCELVKRYRVTGSGANRTRINATPECGDRSPSFRHEENKQGMIPTPECGDRSPTVRQNGQQGPPRGPVLLDGEFQQFYALIDGLLADRLAQPPPMAILETQYARLREADVPLGYLETRLRLRLNKFRSYGLLEYVVSDCIAAVQQARASGERADACRADGQGALLDADAIRLRMREHARALPRDRVFGEVRELLETAAREAPRHAEDIVHLEMHLENVEAMLAQVGEEALSPEQRAQVDSEVEVATREHRDRMSLRQYNELRAQAFRGALFRVLSLPRLGLFAGS